MSVADDKSDNEMIPEAMHKSPRICLTGEETPRKPQFGDRLMMGLQMRSVGSHSPSGREMLHLLLFNISSGSVHHQLFA